jgi:hypothetical protein
MMTMILMLMKIAQTGSEKGCVCVARPYSQAMTFIGQGASSNAKSKLPIIELRAMYVFMSTIDSDAFSTL